MFRASAELERAIAVGYGICMGNGGCWNAELQIHAGLRKRRVGKDKAAGYTPGLPAHRCSRVSLTTKLSSPLYQEERKTSEVASVRAHRSVRVACCSLNAQLEPVPP